MEAFGENWWTYDGVCPNLEVFGVMLNFGGLPKFKFKVTKMAPDDFQDLIGSLGVSIWYVVSDVDTYFCSRWWLSVQWKIYDVLRLTSDVNIQWKLDQGTFKFSGFYGK